MSGFGINIQWEVAKELGPVKLWREDSFMQQLSLNGSLLLLENHDSLWQSILKEKMQVSNVTWKEEVEILKEVKASYVRVLLWQTSSMWLKEMMQIKIELHKKAMQNGLFDLNSLQVLEENLKLKAWQLNNLKWVLEDEDSGRIQVISGNKPRRKNLEEVK